MISIELGTTLGALGIGLVLKRKECPIFLLSLLIGAGLLVWPVETFSLSPMTAWVLDCPLDWSHWAWTRIVWVPVVLVLIPLQGLMCLEGFFLASRRLPKWGKCCVPEFSLALGLLALACSLAFWGSPGPTWVSEIVLVTKVQRVSSWVLLGSGIGLFWAVRRAVLGTWEGFHLLWLFLWMTSWLVPVLRPLPPTWNDWLGWSWISLSRLSLLSLWCLTTATIYLRSRLTAYQMSFVSSGHHPTSARF